MSFICISWAGIRRMSVGSMQIQCNWLSWLCILLDNWILLDLSLLDDILEKFSCDDFWRFLLAFNWNYWSHFPVMSRVQWTSTIMSPIPSKCKTLTHLPWILTISRRGLFRRMKMKVVEWSKRTLIGHFVISHNLWWLIRWIA